MRTRPVSGSKRSRAVAFVALPTVGQPSPTVGGRCRAESRWRGRVTGCRALCVLRGAPATALLDRADHDHRRHRDHAGNCREPGRRSGASRGDPDGRRAHAAPDRLSLAGNGTGYVALYSKRETTTIYYDYYTRSVDFDGQPFSWCGSPIATRRPTASTSTAYASAAMGTCSRSIHTPSRSGQGYAGTGRDRNVTAVRVGQNWLL